MTPLKIAAALMLALPLMTQPALAKSKTPSCPAPAVWNTQIKYLDGYRVFTGADGDSQVEPYRIEARQIPLLKTGKLLGMFELPKAPNRAVQIVVGPGDVDLPMHPAPYKEMFIMLAGSVSLKTAKFEAQLGPGSVLLFDDVDAKIGHGGRTGPCGYISVSIAP